MPEISRYSFIYSVSHTHTLDGTAGPDPDEIIQLKIVINGIRISQFGAGEGLDEFQKCKSINLSDLPLGSFAPLS